MSAGRETTELREETIRARYDAALALLTGFDHAPRLARAPSGGQGLTVRRGSARGRCFDPPRRGW